MRILVVEDQEHVARVLAKGLREESFAVDIASDGRQALFLAETSAYDLILLDVLLPEVDGLEVCRTLRANDVVTPVLMLTARDSVAAKIDGLNLGADDYLTKPFDFNELLARVRALLRRGPLYRAPRLAVADLELDTNTHEAARGGHRIGLTAKEYALLEHFMRNPSRIVTRAHISEHVWDESFDPFSNIVEIYVSRLRRKVDDGFSPKLLHTRRGAGYLFGPVSETDDEV
jgi:two-component system copper resistance phosphate regulon response regulator CusR